MNELPSNIPNELKEVIKNDPMVAMCFKASPTYIQALELSIIELSKAKTSLIEAITQLHIDNSKHTFIK